ncbi:ATP-binding protein [Streptomyces fulvorobeus]|uniref:ATP-binding protein n=1 Tax=Streptomyces fulvorobeus TaxID=284028 RepID=UPI0015C8B7F6|nr:ATP-binding protein [Streptomyces fulvorobeus]
MTKDTSLYAVGWAQSFPISRGVRAGRRWTRDHLASMEWTRNAPESVDAILLSVSELITNAHVHARSDAQLVITWDSRCLHVSVHDSAPMPPTQQPEDLTTTGGRGLAIVDALADGWATHPQASGKTVTACFVPPGAPKPSHGGDIS